jgi:thermitase
MKRIILLIVLLTIKIQAQEVSFENDKIILSLKTGIVSPVSNLSELNELKFLYQNYPVKEVKPLNIVETNILNGRPLVVIFESPVEIEFLIKKLKATNLFDYVEFDFIAHGSSFEKNNSKLPIQKLAPVATTPNDQYFFRQWGLHNNGSFSLSPSNVDADVDMIEAWDITTGNQNIVMAVIDSGINMNHPEFSNRFFTNTNEQNNGFDDDNNNYVDDINGWDFVNNDNSPIDDHGHGTNVTGIAMANGNNNIGYAGVDWNCKLLPLKVLNQNNSGSNSNIIASIYYAINRGVDVISISIGGSGYSVAYENVINDAYNQNIPIIACMMNFNNNVSYYPAAFNSTIAVGSTNPDDSRSAPFFWSDTSGSNFGNHIDIVAPGNYMYGLSYNSNTSYGSYWGGTSQATPLVAGIVSLMLSISPNLSVDAIQLILRNTAQDQVGNPLEDILGWDQYFGSGRVNAFNALSYLQNLSNNNINLNMGTLLYPNPTKDTLYINTSIISDAITVAIFDITGRHIKTFKNVTNNIDVSELKNGIYIANIVSKDTSYSNKFIKK